MFADNGAAFSGALQRNVPKMMFVFLPLLAAGMWALYIPSRRYYVEHVVFLLHNHAALFASFILVALLRIPAHVSPGAAALHRVAGWVVVMYAPWYTYAALRRYYQQGHLTTMLKYVAVGLFYCVSLLLTLIGVALWSILES